MTLNLSPAFAGIIYGTRSHSFGILTSFVAGVYIYVSGCWIQPLDFAKVLHGAHSEVARTHTKLIDHTGQRLSLKPES